MGWCGCRRLRCGEWVAVRGCRVGEWEGREYCGGGEQLFLEKIGPLRVLYSTF